MTMAALLGRIQVSAAEVMASHAPRWKHRNKRAVFEHVCPPGTAHAGRIAVSRWGQPELTLGQPWRPARCELRADVFAYEPRTHTRAGLDWHLNFAHQSLFIAYGGPLLAQDELQVLEHPALAAIREWLHGLGDPRLAPLTRDTVATPVLIRGVERRCALATEGLYGNAFARASTETVVAAARVLRPPTISNIVAIEAPSGGVGRYSLTDIHDALATAVAGFAAARAETAFACGGEAETVVHTGHWGTGAYGGDRVLMAMLQLVAAGLAGVDRLVFHTVDGAGAPPVEQALARLEPLAGRTLAETIAAIDEMGFCWGVSNGT